MDFLFGLSSITLDLYNMVYLLVSKCTIFDGPVPAVL
jgi:hypothetical protein